MFTPPLLTEIKGYPILVDVARILIVDDDTDLVQILTKALQVSGYEVHSAPEPVSGLNLARKIKPDLIILDYHMPGTSGAHLFESFRRNQNTNNTPIIFMSGEATREQIQSEIAEDQLTRFLSKPAHITDLREIIRDMLPTPR